MKINKKALHARLTEICSRQGIRLSKLVHLIQTTLKLTPRKFINIYNENELRTIQSASDFISDFGHNKENLRDLPNWVNTSQEACFDSNNKWQWWK